MRHSAASTILAAFVAAALPGAASARQVRPSLLCRVYDGIEHRLQSATPARAAGLPDCPTCQRWPAVLRWTSAAWRPVPPARDTVAACQGCGQSVADISEAPDDMSIW